MYIAPVRDVKLSSGAGTCTVWNLADFHLGTKNCDEDKIPRIVEAIRADRNALWVGLGDLLECVQPQDTRRFDIRLMPDWIMDDDEAARCPIEAQKARLRRLLKPIADKCLGIIAGNHEEDAARYYGQMTAAWLAGEFKAPYLDCYGAIPLRILSVGRHIASLMCMIVATHGHSYGTTAGGRAMLLQRLIDNHEGVDVIFCGHLHHAQHVVSERVGFSQWGTDTRACRCVAIMSGALLRTYAKGQPSYASRRGYKPSVLGPLAAEIGVDRHRRGEKTEIEILRVRCVEPRY